jgi:3-isopropylmalate/(R)-2-methylmalate dehydratase small subunit
VRLPTTSCNQLREQLHAAPGAQMTIDLETQSVTGPDQALYPFTIDVFDRMRLLEGLDDISLTQQHEKTIESFEAIYRDQNAWAFDS